MTSLLRRRLASVAAAAAIAAGATACTDDDLDAGEARLSVPPGARVLAGAGPGTGELEAVTGERTIGPGTRVKVAGGDARVALAGGAELELRRGTEVIVSPTPNLVAGDLLVASTGGAPLTLRAGGTSVRSDGPARLSRDLGLLAASYRGGLRIDSAGRALDVPALRQVDVASLGVVPAEPEPLAYDGADSWDRRFLGDAIALGDELEAKSAGFTRSLRPGEGRTLGFYRLLLPALEREPAFDEALLAGERAPGETLVGATIAVESRRAPFAARWREIFAFREQGAAWGLVALDQRVRDVGALVGALDTAIARAPLAFAAPTTGPGAAGGAGSGAAGSSPSAGGGSGQSGPSPGAGGSRPPSGGGAGPAPGTTPSGPAPGAPAPPPTTPAPPPTTLPPAPNLLAPLDPVVEVISGLL